MTDAQRNILALVSILLEYPDEELFGNIARLKQEIDTYDAAETAILRNFLDNLARNGLQAAQQEYVETFDLDPSASLYMSWHRYGNDRSQGKAMAALNGLYRQAGFEPDRHVLPDYLPKLLEFISICEDWATEVILDGFGPELAALEERLTELGCPHAPVLKLALSPLRQKWARYFRPRTGPDPTARPMAQPQPEYALVEPVACRRAAHGQENEL